MFHNNSYNRGISVVTSELSLCGPKDSFIEDYDTNYQLIKKRISSSSLFSTLLSIGRYTKTKVGILYLNGIVKKDLVNHVLNKLKDINIDGILDSTYLKHSLEENFHIFPTILFTERPDKCSMALLEGKVVILVDNSPFAIILPCFFFDTLHTTDDYYQKPFNVSFIRIVRLFAFFFSIFLPGFTVSVTTRNYSCIPLSLLLILKAGRLSSPFPAYLEAFFLILCFEILKESDLRMSTVTGSAISILGGLILGEAAVSAGLVSPIIIIVIALSSISGLIFPSIELSNALRFYKVFILILSSFFGLLGLGFGFLFLFYDLFSTKIFGYSYFSFTSHDIYDSILRISSRIQKRNSKLTSNIIRGRYHL